MDLHIMYQDNHLFVVKKDFNVKIEQLDIAVKEFLTKQNGSANYLKRLNNLDSLSSGVVVYVLTSKAYLRLTKQEVDAKFLCVTVGSTQNAEGYFTANVEDLGQGKLGIAPPVKNSFKIDLYYKLLQTQSKISLFEVVLGSLDAKQLRFAMSQLKCPVFGDRLYGGDTLAQNTNLALMLYSVEIEHPTTHNKMTFKCIPTEDAKPWSYFKLDNLFKFKG